METIRVTVRDGRVGRDPFLVTPDGGEVLMTFDSPRIVEIGETLTLPSGALVEVIGYTLNLGMNGGSTTQAVHIGDT